MTYRVFARNWWKENPDWPNGLEPLAVPMDSCRTIRIFNTEEEAREFCMAFNDGPRTKRQIKFGYKYEYTST